MAPKDDIDEARRAALREAIVAAIRAHGGNRTHAADALGYSDAKAMRRAAVRLGLDLAVAAPPLKPQEYGGLRTGAAAAKRAKARKGAK